MHINKVHRVTTITRVAEQLGEDEDWLRDVANEMDTEDGLIWSMASEKTGSWRSPTSESRP
jgi:hypothetical protein